MASDWLLERRGLTGVGSTPTPSPVQRIPTPTAKPAQPVAPKPSQPVSVKKQEPQRYLGGNLLDKAFDILRTPEYAGTGYVQGGVNKAKELGIFRQAPIKSLSSIPTVIKAGIQNIPKAISERREFGREQGQFNIAEEAGVKNKYAQTGLNLAASLAMPSLALGAVAKGVGKIPGVSKVVQKAGKAVEAGVEIARKTPTIAKAAEVFDPFFRNPELGKMVKEAEERIATRQRGVIETVQKAAKGLNKSEQQIIGQILEGKAVSDPTGKYTALAQPVREMADAIGKEAVDLGILDPRSYEKYKGKYMTHIWEKMRSGGDVVSFGQSIVPKTTSKFLTKQRKGAEGYITEFSPAMLKGLGSEVKDVEVERLYKQIVDRFGQPAGSILEKGSAYAPSSVLNQKAGRIFRGKELPQDVVDLMKKTLEPKKRGAFDKAYDLWKKGKTIYNPAYHVRNLLSNQVLSDMSTGEGLGKTILGYGKSVGAYKGKGNQQFVEAAKGAGLIGREHISKAFEEAMTSVGRGKKTNVLQKADKAITGLQNASEETAKLNVFTTWVKRAAKEAGKTVEDALKDEGIVKMAKDKAEEAIFSPYNISKGERSLASKIVPFYSFTRQATPFVAKTALNRPGALTKYEKGKSAIEGLSSDRTNEYRPEEQKGSIRLPFKDKEGRSYYFNPQYILPYGNMGEDFGGDLSKGRLPLGLSLAPYLSMPIEMAANKQLYYGQPITKSNLPEEQRKDYAEYIKRSVAPTVVSSADKLGKAITGEPDWAGRRRNLPAAAADVFGLKTASFVPEEQRKFDMNDYQYQLNNINKEIKKWMKSTDPNKQKKIDKLKQMRKDLTTKRSSI